MNLSQQETCFVCGSKVNNTGIVLCIGQTFYTKSSLLSKICQLVGGEFMLVVSEEDKVCRRCVALVNRCDKLELDLLETKNLFNKFINLKYNIKSEENVNCSSAELDCLKADDQLGVEDLIFHETSVMHEVVYQDDQQYLLISDNIDTGKEQHNNRKVELKEDLVKCELSAEEKSKIISKKSSEISSLKEEQLLLEEMPSKEIKKEKDISDCTTSVHFLNCTERIDLVEEIYTSLPKSNNSTILDIDSIISETINENTLPDKKYIKSVESEKNGNNLSNNEVLFGNSIKKTSPTANYPKRKFVKKRLKNKHFESTLSKRNRLILPKPSYISVTSSLDTTNNVHSKESYCHGEFFNENIRVEDIKKEVVFYDYYSDQGKKNACKSVKSVCTENVQRKKSIVSLRCTICKSDFENEEILKIHKKSHFKNGVFSCSDCPRAFKTKTGLTHHIALKHTGKFNYCCDLCGKGFMSQINFEEHCSSHRKEHLYVCDICGKKFSYKGSYWIHKKWHSDPTPYKCDDCGQLFKHSSVLAVHRRKHTGERPYRCTACPQTFTCSSTFKRHMILHTKMYPYTCEKCKLGFTTRLKYSEHMTKVHGEAINKLTTKKKEFQVDEGSCTNNAVVISQDILETKNENNEINLAPYFTSKLTDKIVEIVLTPSSVISITDDWV